jgi:hypothetical protein
MQFRVTLPCKPYVKYFLESSFGDPVHLKKDRILYAELRSRLKQKSKWREKQFSKYKMYRYSEHVYINISRDDFYRLGWELTYTDINSFNLLLESRVKYLMYSTVGLRVSMGMNLKESIDAFCDDYGFTEDIWPRESIYKDCQRNLSVPRNHLISEFSKFFNKYNLDTLSIKKDNVSISNNPYETGHI